MPVGLVDRSQCCQRFQSTRPPPCLHAPHGRSAVAPQRRNLAAVPPNRHSQPLARLSAVRLSGANASDTAQPLESLSRRSFLRSTQSAAFVSQSRCVPAVASAAEFRLPQAEPRGRHRSAAAPSTVHRYPSASVARSPPENRAMRKTHRLTLDRHPKLLLSIAPTSANLMLSSVKTNAYLYIEIYRHSNLANLFRKRNSLYARDRNSNT